jgi:hypothetical protein
VTATFCIFIVAGAIIDYISLYFFKDVQATLNIQSIKATFQFVTSYLRSFEFVPWYLWLWLYITLMKPAFIIHLWLPLFALSTLVVRLIYLIFRAVEWAQWFLKQGDAHPLKAIGIVATIIVFGSAMLVKEGWALLSVLEGT